MFTINLLPQEEKRLVRLEEARRIIRFFAGGLISVLFIGSALLAPSFLPLFLERRELERSLQLEKEAGQALNVAEATARLRAFKSALFSIKAFVQTPPRASEILEDLFRQSRDGITIVNITIKKGGDVILTGTAESRDNLLRFEKNLRDSGKFQEISSPLSNIIRETNINFTMKGKLKPAFSL
ncbi:MAG: hypothetical protein HYW91_00825 [Candidatus Sungbacteria bacterium]|nr:hypothetical protein [Candidatus Sungbacteria bacterium]